MAQHFPFLSAPIHSLTLGYFLILLLSQLRESALWLPSHLPPGKAYTSVFTQSDMFPQDPGSRSSLVICPALQPIFVLVLDAISGIVPTEWWHILCRLFLISHLERVEGHSPEEESRQSSGPGGGNSLLPAASPRWQVKPDSDYGGAKVETYQPQTEGVGVPECCADVAS